MKDILHSRRSSALTQTLELLARLGSDAETAANWARESAREEIEARKAVHNAPQVAQAKPRRQTSRQLDLSLDGECKERPGCSFGHTPVGGQIRGTADGRHLGYRVSSVPGNEA
jgi:hypothetical protein